MRRTCLSNFGKWMITWLCFLRIPFSCSIVRKVLVILAHTVCRYLFIFFCLFPYMMLPWLLFYDLNSWAINFWKSKYSWCTFLLPAICIAIESHHHLAFNSTKRYKSCSCHSNRSCCLHLVNTEWLCATRVVTLIISRLSAWSMFNCNFLIWFPCCVIPRVTTILTFIISYLGYLFDNHGAEVRAAVMSLVFFF